MNIPNSIVESILDAMEQAIADGRTLSLKKSYAILDSLYEGNKLIPIINEVISKEDLANLKGLIEPDPVGFKKTIPAIRYLRKLFPNINLKQAHKAVEYIINHL